jgi:hypothetical protein
MYFRKQKNLEERSFSLLYKGKKKGYIWLAASIGAAIRGIISLLDGWNHIILGIPT